MNIHLFFTQHFYFSSHTVCPDGCHVYTDGCNLYYCNPVIPQFYFIKYPIYKNYTLSHIPQPSTTTAETHTTTINSSYTTTSTVSFNTAINNTHNSNPIEFNQTKQQQPQQSPSQPPSQATSENNNPNKTITTTSIATGHPQATSSSSAPLILTTDSQNNGNTSENLDHTKQCLYYSYDYYDTYIEQHNWDSLDENNVAWKIDDSYVWFFKSECFDF